MKSPVLAALVVLIVLPLFAARDPLELGAFGISGAGARPAMRASTGSCHMFRNAGDRD